MTNLDRMSLSLPPLSCFRAFEATARHLSFTLAAREMNVTQSAVSQQVRTLETKLGQALFIRKAKSLTLTDAGRRLMPFAAAAISELVKGTEMFLTARGREIVSVSCTTSFAQLWLVPHLRDFNARHPDITVQITSTLWPDDYLTRKTDVEVHFGRSARPVDRSTLLMPIRFVPVCAPAISAPLTGLDELWDLPLIETVGALYGWSRWARQFGTPPRLAPIFNVDSMILAQSMAVSGLGVALLSPRLCREALDSGQIHVLLDLPTMVEDCFYFNVTGGAGNRAAVSAFCDWMAGAANADGG